MTPTEPACALPERPLTVQEPCSPVGLCTCLCHAGVGVMHIKPCCRPCERCGARVRNGAMQNHLEAARGHADNGPLTVPQEAG